MLLLASNSRGSRGSRGITGGTGGTEKDIASRKKASRHDAFLDVPQLTKHLLLSYQAHLPIGVL